MKKKIAFISGILSLIPLGQTLVIKTGVILSTIVWFSSPFEKVNAQNIKLTCEIQNHFKNSEDVIWSDSESDWELEIDQKRRIITQKMSVFYEGKTHNIKFDFSIINQDVNKIIAISDQRTSIKGGPYITSLTLDFNNKRISGANIISDYRGVAFAIYDGKCF